MDCTEFQKQLPYVIDTGGNAEQEAHLRTCAVCSDLVQDLRYIAEQAKLLVPMHEPHPRVWDGIQRSLAQEGLVRPAPAGRFQPVAIAGGASRWGMWTRLGAAAAVLLVALSLIMYRNPEPTTDTAENRPAATKPGTMDENDRQLLEVISNRAPERAEVYRASLAEVNAYIAEAEERLRQNPNDEAAREHLLRGYEQKALLYDLGTTGQ